MIQLFLYTEKEFVSRYGAATISRQDYEDLMCPMIAIEMSDEQMQKIVDKINLSMQSDYDLHELGLLERYRGGGCGMTQEQINFADTMSEREFEYFENCAREIGMRYYEDLESWEYEEIKQAVESAE